MRLELLVLLALAAACQAQDESRLPLNVIPRRYELDIVIILEDQFEFEGDFAIEADVAILGDDNDGTIIIHGQELEVEEDSLEIADMDTGDSYPVLGLEYDAPNRFVLVSYAAPASDHSVRLSGRFSGEMETIEDGLYRDSYVDTSTGEARSLAATQFATDGARKAFPCLDEPDLKATFKVRIGRLESLRSHFNTELVSEGGEAVAGRDGYVWDEYEETPLMSTYIVAFAVTDFAAEEAEDVASNGVRHTSWARRDAVELGYAEYIVNDIEPGILDFYEDIWGLPFPLDKQDQISYPSKGGAMENWGLVVYAEDLILYDEAQTGALEREDAIMVNAHENAHMYFGDLVTCEWWDAIWLNEGYAEYIMYLGSDEVAPDMRVWDRFYVKETDGAMRFDGTTDSHPTIQEVPTAGEVDFGTITYDRGAAMNLFLETILTFDTFNKGLNRYLQDLQFDAAYFDDVFDHLTEAGHEDGTLDDDLDIEEIMDTWMRQMNYPLITVEYDADDAIAVIEQSRFLYDPENANPGDDYRWYVPLSFTCMGGAGEEDFEDTARFTQFIRPEVDVLAIDACEGNAVIFNIGALGYLRVNYDDDNWDALRDELLLDHTRFDVRNRVQLLSDSFALAEAGIESYSRPLEVFQYLTQEREEPPLEIALQVMLDLEGSNPTSNAGILFDFIASRFTALYNDEELGGIEADESRDHFGHLTQRIIIRAVNFLALDRFEGDSAEVFQEWMDAQDPDDPAQNPVNRHIRRQVYCAAVRRLGSPASAFLGDRAPRTALPQEADAIAHGMSCLGDKSEEEVAATTLDPILEHPDVPVKRPPIRLMEMAAERSHVAAMKWIEQHFDEIKRDEKRTHAMLEKVLETFYKRGRSEEEIQLIRQFQSNHLLSERSSALVDMAEKGIRLNIMKRSRRSSDE